MQKNAYWAFSSVISFKPKAAGISANQGTGLGAEIKFVFLKKENLYIPYLFNNG